MGEIALSIFKYLIRKLKNLNSLQLLPELFLNSLINFNLTLFIVVLINK
jgi:hypothetical protein